MFSVAFLVANPDQDYLYWKAKAQLKLGIMFKMGRGVAQDDKKAYYWFKKTVYTLKQLTNPQFCKVDSDCQRILGIMYAEGKGIEQDYDKASDWLKKAAEQRDTSAKFNLSFMHYKGRGFDQDEDKACFWFKKSGNHRAHCALGHIYIKHDAYSAFDYFNYAAQEGNAEAQFNIAQMYLKGRGTVKCPGTAIDYYKRAAHQGYIPSLYCIVDILVKGLGIPPNYTHAFGYLLILISLNPNDEKLKEIKVHLLKNISDEQLAESKVFATKVCNDIDRENNKAENNKIEEEGWPKYLSDE